MRKLTENTINPEISHWCGKLDQLIDGKIIKSVWYKHCGDVFIGITIEMPDKRLKTLWFLSDEEGNGAGRFRVV